MIQGTATETTRVAQAIASCSQVLCVRRMKMASAFVGSVETAIGKKEKYATMVAPQVKVVAVLIVLS